jgi:hypothetical protein
LIASSVTALAANVDFALVKSDHEHDRLVKVASVGSVTSAAILGSTPLHFVASDERTDAIALVPVLSLVATPPLPLKPAYQ